MPAQKDGPVPPEPDASLVAFFRLAKEMAEVSRQRKASRLAEVEGQIVGQPGLTDRDDGEPMSTAVTSSQSSTAP
jgi:hypothetical protein